MEPEALNRALDGAHRVFLDTSTASLITARRRSCIIWLATCFGGSPMMEIHSLATYRS